MPQVNITLNIRRMFAWQIGNSDWSPDRRAAIFSQFWSRVKRADSDACWPWVGHLASHGYGVFACAGFRVRAHRFAWWASRGPIPTGVEVCHRCDNPACVNPAHLFLGSHRDNHLDAVRKGRKGCFGRQKLDAAKVREVRRLVAAGACQRVVAAQFGIARNTVSQIVNRKSWAHLDAA